MDWGSHLGVHLGSRAGPPTKFPVEFVGHFGAKDCSILYCFSGPLFNEFTSFLPANLGAMSEAILLPNTSPKHDNNSTCLCLMAPRFALGCLFGSSLGAAFGGLLFFHSEHFETQKYTPKLGEQNRIEPNKVMCEFFQSARRTAITRLATLVPSL